MFTFVEAITKNYLNMRKKLFFLMIGLLALSSCGDSEEEKAITNAIYYKYKEEAINTGTYVRFEVPSIKIKSKEECGDTIKYNVEFGIMEMYPDRNVYYKGNADVVSIGQSAWRTTSFYYSTCTLKDLP